LSGTEQSGKLFLGTIIIEGMLKDLHDDIKIGNMSNGTGTKKRFVV